MKILKRIIFVILVLINLTLLFIPEMIYWVIKGHGFLGDRLNLLYAKWVLPLLLIILLSCEKDNSQTECKECTMVINYPEETVIVFACGDELKKIEQKYICKTKPSKQ